MLLSPSRLWRGFGTALFLALIGLGGTAMALSVFPLIALVVRAPDSRQRQVQWVMHQTFRLYCGAIKRMRIADLEFVGTERLKDLRGTLIVANHPSLLDVVMIMAALPSVQCVVKAGLWRNPFFRLTVSSAGYIRNDLPPEQLVEACVDVLRSGKNLIVFPEGTRTVPGTSPRLRRGFANIATLAEANLQLVTITCDPPVLHKGNPWWHVPERRSHFRMEVGERLEIDQFLRHSFRPLSARKLVSFVENYYSEKLKNGQSGALPQGSHSVGLEAGGSIA